MPSEEEMTYQADLPRLVHPSITCRKQKRAREKTVCKLLVANLLPAPGPLGFGRTIMTGEPPWGTEGIF